MTIENCWIKAKILSVKYRPRNRGKENDLRRKKFVKLKEDRHRAVNEEIKERIDYLTWQN